MGHIVRFPSSWESPFALPRQEEGKSEDDRNGTDSDFEEDKPPENMEEERNESGPGNSDDGIAGGREETPFLGGSTESMLMDLDPVPLDKSILRVLNDSRRAPVIPGEFDLDSVLSQLPYRLILERGVCNSTGSDESNVQVPIVSRVYEESYLREPFHGERACASGALCECNFIDKSMPFVGVEFVPYGVKRDSNPSFCVLCSRKITQKLFYDVMLSGRRVEGTIQRYGNIVNVPGEYARECALICPAQGAFQCLPVPIVSHQRNKYEVYTDNGVRVLRQLRVGYEDFHRPSTEEAS